MPERFRVPPFRMLIVTPSAIVTLFEICTISPELIVKSESIFPPLMCEFSESSVAEVIGENRIKTSDKLSINVRNFVAMNLPKHLYVFKMFSNQHLSNPFYIQKY